MSCLLAYHLAEGVFA
jgi:hypothetical protein